MPRWLVIALLIVVVVAFVAKHYSASHGSPAPAKPQVSTTAAILSTGFPCETDYSKPCTRDQYMVIAKRNCAEIEATGEQCRIADANGSEPHAVGVLNDSERALWLQQQDDDIRQTQQQGYECVKHNDPPNDSYGYRCWLPGYQGTEGDWPAWN
jgi:hypothetical protein